jgi:ribosomal protein S1
MDGYSWPEDGQWLAARTHRTWDETVAAFPVGTPITGEVIGRQRFGVFIRVDGATCAVGLAEITTMPRDAELPAMGTHIAGEVSSHAEHNHQVMVRLNSW